MEFNMGNKMDLYTDYMLESESLHKLSISLKSNRDYLYSGWEINQITNTLNNVYYKNELLNTIKSLVKNGTSPNDIYILNASVKIGKEYNEIRDGLLDLSNPKDVYNFFALGSPISLIPDTDSLNIYYIFEIYRQMLKKVKASGLQYPNKRIRQENLYNLFIERNEINDATKLFNILRDMMYEVNRGLINDTEELESGIRKLFKILESPLGIYENFCENLHSIDTLSNSLKRGTEVNDKLLNKHLKYIEFFHRTFNKFQRPFICVHNREVQTLHIICTDLIAVENFTEYNYRFFETNRIAQNSPLEIIICLGIGFAPSLFKIGEAYIYSRMNIKTAKEEELERKIELQERGLEVENVLLEIESLDNEIKEIDSDIEKMLKHTVSNEEINQSVRQTENFIANSGSEDDIVFSSLEMLEDRNNHNLFKTLEDKDLIIEDVAIESGETVAS